MSETGNVGRRDFLKSTALGLGGVVYLAQAETKPTLPPPSASPSAAPAAPPKDKWIYRTLGRTGIKVPVLSFGVMNSDNPNLVKAALDAGLLHLDTAFTYMQGRNEEMIGQMLKGRPRNSFVISTKVHLDRNNPREPFPADLDVSQMEKRLDISLKRLGLDYVDLFYNHNIGSRHNVLFEPAMKQMDKLKSSGKVKHVGLSTHTNEPEVIRAAAESKFFEVVLTTYNFKQQQVGEIKAAVAQAAQAGMGVVAMKAVGGHRLFKDGKLNVNARAAIKWVLQDPHVHTVIAGCTTFDQLTEDLPILADLTMTEQEKKDIQAASAVAGLFCQNCGQCLDQCRFGLPIPELMRAYMYTYGYRNLGAAHDLLTELKIPVQACGDCAACPVKCAVGFDVAAKVRDVARLAATPREFLV